jgi:hypothetical protein
MKILGVDDPFYMIHYGHGAAFNFEGPFYEASEAEERIPGLMGVKMKHRSWLTIKKDEVVVRRWTQIAEGVWKEWRDNEKA